MKIWPLVLFERKVIGEVDQIPLMIRYFILRLPGFGIYLHHLLRSDYDRAWPVISVLLTDGYAAELKKHDPELFNQVQSGTVSISQATKVLNQQRAAKDRKVLERR